MQRVWRLEQGQVDRHGGAEQRQQQGHNHTLHGEGAVQELIAVQFANQAHKTLCGNEIHGYADRDERRSKPE
jgi:hypothetical protein